MKRLESPNSLTGGQGVALVTSGGSPERSPLPGSPPGAAGCAWAHLSDGPGPGPGFDTELPTFLLAAEGALCWACMELES